MYPDIMFFARTLFVQLFIFALIGAALWVIIRTAVLSALRKHAAEQHALHGPTPGPTPGQERSSA
ncbi:hypothetical protein [Leucobacter aridicollis]|uniref:hypothetical protein n=1 Tax=Leucobacter aridicollis TaxID=283878 RepID=UPI002105D44A|nr:hypothetical protein [Leucobacter aridicollis]UTX51956.1 hypothetical protein KI794_09230 [Leucobacter aridicollis]